MAEFADKVGAAVQVFLMFDVTAQLGAFPGSRAEGKVAVLPTGKLWKNMPASNPDRGGCLDLRHEIGKGQRGVQADQQMNVIIDAADPLEVGSARLDNAPDIAEQILTAVFA